MASNAMQSRSSPALEHPTSGTEHQADEGPDQLTPGKKFVRGKSNFPRASTAHHITAHGMAWSGIAWRASCAIKQPCQPTASLNSHIYLGTQVSR